MYTYPIVLCNMTKPIENKFDRIAELLNAFMGNKFDNYIELQNFVENHIGTVSKELDDKFQEVDKIKDADEWNTEMSKLEDELGYEGFKFDHEFPNRIRFSSIIQTYSMLEVYLKWLCERLRKINQNPFGIADLKGNSDLEKGKLYLKRVYNLDFSKLEPEWSFLNDMRKIRNQIIHNNGEFQTKDIEIIRIIEKIELLGRMWDDIEPEMKPNTDYEIKIVSKELNIKFINNVRTFFAKVLSEIKTSEINTA